jgi:hypothetical protein
MLAVHSVLFRDRGLCKALFLNRPKAIYRLAATLLVLLMTTAQCWTQQALSAQQGVGYPWAPALSSIQLASARICNSIGVKTAHETLQLVGDLRLIAHGRGHWPHGMSKLGLPASLVWYVSSCPAHVCCQRLPAGSAHAASFHTRAHTRPHGVDSTLGLLCGPMTAR